MNLSEQIAWDIVNEFQKRGWLSKKAEMAPNAEHICMNTMKPIAKKVEQRIKENVTKNVVKLMLEEE